MRNAVAVMNTKGGVGKSTLVLAIAEALSARFGKTVLVIDADSQASVSLMLLSAGNLNRLQLERLTIVDLLVDNVLKKLPVDWTRFVIAGVSDVDEARSICLVPSDMQLALFEREASKEQLLVELRAAVAGLLEHTRGMFDVVLIDCPPGLSVLTESWLREADFQISPTNPDSVSSYALEVLNHFKGLNPEMGFAENLGVLITMQADGAAEDERYARGLMGNADNNCFNQAIPLSKALQHVGRFSTTPRSFDTKYPGTSGLAVRNVCEELLSRLALANRSSDLANVG